MAPGGRPGHSRAAVAPGAVRAGESLPRIFAVHTGQCLNSAPNEMSGVHVVNCASPHDAEVFGTFRVASHRYPGTPALRRDAGLGCASRLSAYLNPELASASLTESYVYPDAGAWAACERTVVCTIRSATGQLTGVGVRAARVSAGGPLARCRNGRARLAGGLRQWPILSAAPGTMEI